MPVFENLINYLQESGMTNTERAALNRGWDDGEHNAINACFPQHKRPWPHGFDSPEEEEAYDRGYRNGYNSID